MIYVTINFRENYILKNGFIMNLKNDNTNYEFKRYVIVMSFNKNWIEDHRMMNLKIKCIETFICKVWVWLCIVRRVTWKFINENGARYSSWTLVNMKMTLKPLLHNKLDSVAFIGLSYTILHNIGIDSNWNDAMNFNCIKSIAQVVMVNGCGLVYYKVC